MGYFMVACPHVSDTNISYFNISELIQLCMHGLLHAGNTCSQNIAVERSAQDGQ